MWENIVEESRRDSSNRYQWTGGVDTQEIEEAVPKNAFSFLFEDLQMLSVLPQTDNLGWTEVRFRNHGGGVNSLLTESADKCSAR